MEHFFVKHTFNLLVIQILDFNTKMFGYRVYFALVIKKHFLVSVVNFCIFTVMTALLFFRKCSLKYVVKYFEIE